MASPFIPTRREGSGGSSIGHHTVSREGATWGQHLNRAVGTATAQQQRARAAQCVQNGTTAADRWAPATSWGGTSREEAGR
jgi:hypothetical protein